MAHHNTIQHIPRHGTAATRPHALGVAATLMALGLPVQAQTASPASNAAKTVKPWE
ncbi:hypothetical protein [Delftia sp. UME58]|uniref:hypothetical protein n=1 Tax=Delftia sp. UME58 TaxID=1862322 RepID=UPI0015FF7359|nr:hypothetical protein [Delftia sp. UME58]